MCKHIGKKVMLKNLIVRFQEVGDDICAASDEDKVLARHPFNRSFIGLRDSRIAFAVQAELLGEDLQRGLWECTFRTAFGKEIGGLLGQH